MSDLKISLAVKGLTSSEKIHKSVMYRKKVCCGVVRDLFKTVHCQAGFHVEYDLIHSTRDANHWDNEINHPTNFFTIEHQSDEQ